MGKNQPKQFALQQQQFIACQVTNVRMYPALVGFESSLPDGEPWWFNLFACKQAPTGASISAGAVSGREPWWFDLFACR